MKGRRSIARCCQADGRRSAAVSCVLMPPRPRCPGCPRSTSNSRTASMASRRRMLRSSRSQRPTTARPTTTPCVRNEASQVHAVIAHLYAYALSPRPLADADPRVSNLPLLASLPLRNLLGRLRRKGHESAPNPSHLCPRKRAPHAPPRPLPRRRFWCYPAWRIAHQHRWPSDTLGRACRVGSAR